MYLQESKVSWDITCWRCTFSDFILSFWQSCLYFWAANKNASLVKKKKTSFIWNICFSLSIFINKFVFLEPDLFICVYYYGNLPFTPAQTRPGGCRSRCHLVFVSLYAFLFLSLEAKMQSLSQWNCLNISCKTISSQTTAHLIIICPFPCNHSLSLNETLHHNMMDEARSASYDSVVFAKELRNQGKVPLQQGVVCHREWDSETNARVEWSDVGKILTLCRPQCGEQCWLSF